MFTEPAPDGKRLLFLSEPAPHPRHVYGPQESRPHHKRLAHAAKGPTFAGPFLVVYIYDED
jgi:hypothetical protein